MYVYTVNYLTMHMIGRHPNCMHYGKYASSHVTLCDFKVTPCISCAFCDPTICVWSWTRVTIVLLCELEIFTIAYPDTSASVTTGTYGQRSIPIICGNIHATDDPTHAIGTCIHGRYLHLPGYIQVPAGICTSTCIILIQFSLNKLHYACN